MHFLFQSLAMFVKNLSNSWGSDGIGDNNYNKQTEQLFKGHKELMIFCCWSAISLYIIGRPKFVSSCSVLDPWEIFVFHEAPAASFSLFLSYYLSLTSLASPLSFNIETQIPNYFEHQNHLPKCPIPPKHETPNKISIWKTFDDSWDWTQVLSNQKRVL